MSVGEVSSHDGMGMIRREIIFQSPQVSVAITVLTARKSNVARVIVERTCINDALEDWRPYWRAFRHFVIREKLLR